MTRDVVCIWLFPAVYQKAVVAVLFLSNALKSRTFSPLNATRPKLATEIALAADKKTVGAERKRPSWQPPPLVGHGRAWQIVLAMS